MSILLTTNDPLLIVGTECLVNPSLEDWVSGSPYGWTPTGSVSQELDVLFPYGERSAKLVSGASLAQTISLSLFGLSTFPTWADAFLLAVCAYGSNGSIALGASNQAMSNGAGWNLTYAQLAGSVGNVTITGGSGTTYVDSIMLGFAVDLMGVPPTKWNPIPKRKGEVRKGPYGAISQTVCDSWDLKASLGHFEGDIKAKIIGAISYLEKGHYFACILDRSLSGPFKDEVIPYLYWDSQDSPKFTAGAGVFTFDINGEGALP